MKRPKHLVAAVWRCRALKSSSLIQMSSLELLQFSAERWSPIHTNSLPLCECLGGGEGRLSSCLSSCLSYRFFITFLPDKQHLSLAENFNSPSVCVEPSVLQTETSVNFPQKTASAPHKLLFTDGDCLIMSFSAKIITLSLSRMFGVSGFQSLHIITVSIWL